MVLYINNKVYSKDSPINEILDAIKNLPAPFPNVKTDFDSTIYDLQQEGFFDFVITKKDGTTDFNNEIIGKDGTIFKKESVLDGECYYVNEGNVKFATDKKLSTTNVQDCVALIIQDVNTKKTALAHISLGSSRKFIKSIFNYMPDGKKEVIMIGDRYGSRSKGYSEATNTRKILNIILEDEQDIFINKSYIFEKSYIVDKKLSFMEASYDLNTAKGDIILDTTNLTVKPGFPSKYIPRGDVAHDRVNDLDRLLELSDDSEKVAMYKKDMEDVCYGVYTKSPRKLFEQFNVTSVVMEYGCNL
ncbi:hypothetical protein [Wolbachia endosymbiont of Chironomus riparius]|uniref:hypothetical protein n=1 Tax=Wolbachia endosymbiont of Chironomus riparius TaxID=2883238 RepID=UPI00209F44A7|nr:hypothetical protein [Wolbachia endosymbiont of Chironomus riparius]